MKAFSAVLKGWKLECKGSVKRYDIESIEYTVEIYGTSIL
jgi:hypothetical protein